MIGLFLLFCSIVAIITGIVLVCYGMIVYIRDIADTAEYYHGALDEYLR
jgi:hypothetical protein